MWVYFLDPPWEYTMELINLSMSGNNFFLEMRHLMHGHVIITPIRVLIAFV
jgi:hypothetical protein